MTTRPTRALIVALLLARPMPDAMAAMAGAFGPPARSASVLPMLPMLPPLPLPAPYGFALHGLGGLAIGAAARAPVFLDGDEPPLGPAPARWPY